MEDNVDCIFQEHCPTTTRIVPSDVPLVLLLSHSSYNRFWCYARHRFPHSLHFLRDSTLWPTFLASALYPLLLGIFPGRHTSSFTSAACTCGVDLSPLIDHSQVVQRLKNVYEASCIKKQLTNCT